VIYLLDVNVLLAMKYETHVHHARTMNWLKEIEASERSGRFATCSTTELGFVRIAGNAKTGLAKNVTTARQDLKHLKEGRSFTFLSDPLGAHHLPPWVKTPAHVTDGHLVALAAANGLRLVTLDRGIPDALLLPEHLDGPMMVREPTMPYVAEARYESHVN